MAYQINAVARNVTPAANFGVEWDEATEQAGCGVAFESATRIVVPAGLYNFTAYLEFAAGSATNAGLEWLSLDEIDGGSIDSHSGPYTSVTLSASGYAFPEARYVVLGHSITGASVDVSADSYLLIECLGQRWWAGVAGWA